MPITPLPTPPSRQDPANFAARGDALLTALPTFVEETNGLVAGVNAKEASTVQAASVASSKAGQATDSASAASTSEKLARDWATKATGEVVPGEGYSAKKHALDTAAASAAAAASQAAAGASATSAASNAVASEAARAAAVVAQNNAVAVVTGGTGSLPAAPGKLPLADASGRLDRSWFPVGSGHAQLPAGQHLGRMAFLDCIGVLTPMNHQPGAIRAVWTEFVSNTALKICMRGDDGVVRSTTLTLN